MGKFVQVKRANFEQASVHSLDCYEKSYMPEMGLKTQVLPSAVPVIQALSETNSS